MELIVRRMYTLSVSGRGNSMFKATVTKEMVASLKTENNPVWLEHILCKMEGVRGKSECGRSCKPCLKKNFSKGNGKSVEVVR